MPDTAFSNLRLRLTRAIVPIVEECRSAIGIRRGVHAGGLYYKELTPERLQRALSKRGTGHKDYRVTFPDASKQIVRCSANRCYADLMGIEGHRRLARICALVRPGSRVLEIVGLPYATGYTSVAFARATGQSGAVVSLLTDSQGTSFARRRYVLPNLSIEPADPEQPLGSLIGEVDGAFDAVICLHGAAKPEALPALAIDLWRLVRPGGWLVIGVSRGEADALATAMDTLSRDHSAEAELISDSDEPGGTSDALLRKPAPPPRGTPPSNRR